MTVIMAIFSAFAPPQDKPDSGSGNSGQTQQEVRITLDGAIDIAVADAGVARADARFTEAKLDADDRVPHYDIEFVYGGYEYEFEINAKTGAIIEFDRELEDKKPQVDTSNFITVEEAKAAALKRASLDESQVTFTKTKLDTDDRIPHYGRIIGYEREREEKKPQVDTSKFISADAAKKAALAHAGLTEAQVTELEAELDTDSLTAHYDVEFKCGGYEYEYKINAKSGKVISFEKERD